MSLPSVDRRFFLAIVFILIAYWPLSLMQYSMPFDTANWFFPMRYLIGECLQNNTFPVWNPYTNLGYPIHTDPQSGALYPFVWVLGYFLGYNSYTLHLEHSIHLIFAFIGMYYLGQQIGIQKKYALLIGIIYACCGFFVGNATHLTWIISATWLPFVLLYYYRLILYNYWKDAVGLSLVLFLLLTGGYPAFMITVCYLLLIAFVVTVVKKWRVNDLIGVKKFVINNSLFFILFLLQSAVFLVYFIEMTPLLNRVGGLSLSDAQVIPFSLPSFVSFILPFVAAGNNDFFQTDLTMANAYFGLIGFSIFLFSFFNRPDKKEIYLIIIGILFLLTAIGDAFYFRGFLYHYVPLMDTYRYPSLFRLFTLIPFILVVGLSLQKIFHANVIQKNVLKFRWLVGLMILILSGFWWYTFVKNDFPHISSFAAADLLKFVQQSSLSDRFLIQGGIQISVLLLLFILLKKTSSKYFYRLFFALVLFDVFAATQLNMLVTVVSDEPITQVEKKLAPLPRGFPIPKKHPIKVNQIGNGELRPIYFNTNIFRKEISRNGYNNFKLKTFSAFEKHPSFKEILNQPVLHISAKANTRQKEEINTTVFKPNYLKATVTLKDPAELVYLQTNYPGWKVYLNGGEIEHYTKDGIFIAAALPAGKSEIEFSFHPKHYRKLLFFSSFIFFLCLFLTCLPKPKKIF